MLVVSNNVFPSTNFNESAMSLTEHQPDGVSNSDAVAMIVHSLMCYRQSGESKEFARRAIESLVKKLKERREDLDALMTAVTTSGTQPSKCVTIQRTLDGRMQIAGRKCLPHIIYARIWRWPDLHRNELKHCKFCSYGFDLKQDSVCINPYHYERIVSSVDLAALSLSPSVDHEPFTEYGRDASDSESELPDTTVPGNNDFRLKLESHSPLSAASKTSETDQVTSSTLHARNRLTIKALLDEENPSARNVSSSSSSQHSLTPTDDPHLPCYPDSISSVPVDRVNPAPHIDRGQNTMAWSGIAVPGVHHPSQFPQSSFSTVVSTSENKNQPYEYSRLFGQRNLDIRLMEKSASQSSCGVVSYGTQSGVKNSPNRDSSQPPVSFTTLSTTLSNNQISFSGNGTPGPNGGSTQRGGGDTGNSGGGNSGTGSCSSTGRSASGSSFNAGAPCPGPAGVGGSGGNWGGRGPPQPPFNPSGSLLQPVPVLTTQRPPEFWCNIAYFELDQQVGELFKVPSQYSRVTVDGYTDPSSPNRFCLGQLSNVHRSEQSEKSRLYIGKGVELDNVGEGDVWIRCLSEFSVFVQSYYLDREAGRRPGDAVHKIYPGAYIKVFDIRQCHEQMKNLAHSAQLAAEHQAAVVVGSLPSPSASGPPIPQLLSQLPPGPSQSGGLQGNQGALGGPIPPLATADVGVDDLRRLCMLRLSFVKGWGPDYPRRSIKETPCWIEIQLHRPLQLLDEVLQSMPLNDRKPTRHFIPYFAQPPPTCSAPRPQTAARRT
ncbi:unnamed protein product [Calicophoron daubneyi]|uniref:Mothers against decapentaplegic homolog n=1 Tax=Calicophoron daubneyi TaxID=300641 RepID=A0AAV2U040_CALDB